MTNKSLISAVIAEFNPLHFGHSYLLKQAKRSSALGVVVVMSGNFVQRGEPAAFYKWPRARAALECGADLVLELPLGFSLAGAERFAHGAVSILDSLGCVDTLWFGSECGDINALQTVAATISSPGFLGLIRCKMQSGMPFAAARQTVAEELLGEAGALLRDPNNILGIEYCKSLFRLHSPIHPHTILRIGAAHDSQLALPQEGAVIASASQIRRHIHSGEVYSHLLPESAAQIFEQECAAGRAPASLAPVETAMLARLRTMSREELHRLPDISEGLENRIYAGSRTAVTLEELHALIASKRYPHARIRRILLSAFLGLSCEELAPSPAYARVLAFNEVGREILRVAKRQATLPIIANASDLKNLDAAANMMFQTECRATDLYALCTPVKGPCGLEMTSSYWERKDLFGDSNQRG